MFKKILLLLLMASYFSSCDNMRYTDEEVAISYLPKLTTIIYDSCEYVAGANAYQAVLAHKGNCKYCEQRKEEEKHVDEFKQHVKNILSALDEE